MVEKRLGEKSRWSHTGALKGLCVLQSKAAPFCAELYFRSDSVRDTIQQRQELKSDCGLKIPIQKTLVSNDF